MLTAWDLNDQAASERTRHYLPKFGAAPAPDPDRGDWTDWERLFASPERAPGVRDPNGAMHVATDWGFATVSRSFLALPTDPATRPVWLFAKVWPDPEPLFEVH